MKPLSFKKQYKVTMIIQCRPSLVDHLMDELDSTAQYENALIEQYSFEELDERKHND